MKVDVVGQETTVKQWCPNPLLGTFFYTIDNGTTQTCGNGSRVDVCATWTTMTFDYTKCSSEVLSSKRWKLDARNAAFSIKKFKRKLSKIQQAENE